MKFIEFYELILGLKFIRMCIFGFEKEIKKSLKKTIAALILEVVIAILAYYLLEPVVPKVINFIK